MATIIGTRATVVYIDSVDVTAEVSRAAISTSEKDSDFMSFAEALAGGATDWTLELTLRQDTASASLWYQMWDSAGTDVTYEFWPNGYNSGTPTATYPQFTGSVTITLPDGVLLGGEANKSASATNTTEVKWVCTAKPTLNVA